MLRRLATVLFALSVAGCRCGGDLIQHADKTAEASATELDFGQVYVGFSVERTLTLTETGPGHVSIDSAAITGGPGFAIEGSPAGGLTVKVAFTPTSPGAVTGTLAVENDSDNVPSLSVRLKAEGLPARLCEDNNPCTNDVFHPDTGECTHEKREGSCDDENACTRDDVCVDGVCMGSAVECDDKNRCTRDVCDKQQGCLHLPDVSICDDGDPCTQDLCTPNGCQHPDAPDLTICGPIVTCVSADFCISGTCRTLAVPEGFPCDDHDMCSLDDACHNGVCVGNYTAQDPKIESQLNTFGASHGEFALLDGGRMVFIDKPVAPSGFGGTTLSGPRTLSTVQIAADGTMQLLGSSSGAADEDYSWALGVGTDLLVAVNRDPAGTVKYRVVVQRVLPDGTFERLLDTLTDARFVIGDAALYACDGTSLQITPLQAGATATSWPVVPTLEVIWQAVNEKHGKLVIGSGDSHWSVLDLPSQSGTTVTAVPLPELDGSTVYAYAGDALVAFRSDATSGESEIELRDADTLELRSTIALDPGVTLSGAAVDGTDLYTLVRPSEPTSTSTATLARYDISNLALPRPIAQKAGLDENTYAPIARGGLVALHATDSVYGSGSWMVLRVAAQGFATVSDASYGGVRRLVDQGGILFALDNSSMRTVQLPKTAAPYFSAGGRADRGGGLIRLQGTAPVDVVLGLAVLVNDPLVATNYSAPEMAPLPWTDATSVATPVTGLLANPPDTSIRVWRSEGNRLYAVAVTNSNGGATIAVERYDMGMPYPASDFSLVPAAVSAPSTFPGYIPSQLVRIGIDRASDRVATSFLTSERHLAIYGSDAAGLSLMASAQLGTGSPEISSVAVAGDVVATVLRGAGLQLWQADLSAKTITTLGPVLALPANANHFVGFDGKTALIATTDSNLVFVDTRSAPTILGTLAMPQPPLDAVVRSGKLVVGGNSSVSVVSPPCPPRP